MCGVVLPPTKLSRTLEIIILHVGDYIEDIINSRTELVILHPRLIIFCGREIIILWEGLIILHMWLIILCVRLIISRAADKIIFQPVLSGQPYNSNE